MDELLDNGAIEALRARVNRLEAAIGREERELQRLKKYERTLKVGNRLREEWLNHAAEELEEVRRAWGKVVFAHDVCRDLDELP